MTFVKVDNPVQKKVSTAFDELFNDLPNFIKSTFYTPEVNIVEDRDGFHLNVNAPGREKENFSLVVENGTLTISYEKKEEANDAVKSHDNNQKIIRKEFQIKNFKRSFTLEDKKLETGEIEARYENGILNIYIPKKQEVKEAAKQISIQ